MTIPVGVVIIGGDIVSATLGTLLKQLEPRRNIQIFERLGEVAVESSNPWNNAGTGHAALCELNYTPELADGTIDLSSAGKLNEQFRVSHRSRSYLVSSGQLPDPAAFIITSQHMSVVWGEANAEFLRKRYEALKNHPLFAGRKFSTDARTIRSWAPLMIPGRKKSQPIAATRITSKTDIDFGALSHLLSQCLVSVGAGLNTEVKATNLTRQRDGRWKLGLRSDIGGTPLPPVTARFVFVGARGYALNLLQKSVNKEIRGYWGFPVLGEFLRTDNPELVAHHRAKVYGKAAVGSLPMSVPHLDLRVVGGAECLMFGPSAGFSPKFLKTGSVLDLFASTRWHSIVPMLAAGLSNSGLVKYLVGQLLARPSTKFSELQAFYPNAKPDDSYRITAGQRVQVIKKHKKKLGVPQFGTEVVAAADGSIAGLLGTSPGASSAVPVMVGLIEQCFPGRI